MDWFCLGVNFILWSSTQEVLVCLASFPQQHIRENHPCCCVQQVVLFHCCAFQCMNKQQLIYPFLLLTDTGAASSLGHDEQSCYDPLCASLCSTWLSLCAFPPASEGEFSCPASSSTLAHVCLFHSGHSAGCNGHVPASSVPRDHSWRWVPFAVDD